MRFIQGSRHYCTTDEHINAPVFKAVFDCDDTADTLLHISSTGFYKVYLNGIDITKGLFAPYMSTPNDAVYYDEYEITGKTKNKDNVICVVLGNGYANVMDNNLWDFEKAPFRDVPKLYLKITCNGKEILETGNDFKVADSPITFDDLRAGEHYDARLEDSTLHLPVFSDKFRDVIFSNNPQGEYKKCEAQNVSFHGDIKVKSIIKSGNGYIYDFGSVFSGVCTLKISGEAGQIVDMTFAEMVSCGKLDVSGMLFGAKSKPGYTQRDVYICKDGMQEYTPSFTYHGFRYCYVEGIKPEQATEDLLVAKVVGSDIVKRAMFSCNEEVVNKIQDCALRSAESNFVYIITDCPQREKHGWTSEGHVTSEYILYNYDCVDSLKEWLFLIRKSQKDSGEIPGIVPTSGWGFGQWNGPQWSKIIVEIPYLLYKFTGDISIYEENAEAIIKHAKYICSIIREDDTVEKGLPDWCVAGEGGDGKGSGPVYITDTLISVDILRKARTILNTIDNHSIDGLIDASLSRLESCVKSRFINGNKTIIENQTIQALAIDLGFFDDNKEAAVNELYNIVKKDNYHMHTGVMGYRPVFNVLSDNGYAELVYKMITCESWPSYGNLIKQGATTLWEKFTEYYETDEGIKQKDGAPRNYSLNHCAFGGVSTWFYNYIAGLRIENHNTVTVSPCKLKDIKNVCAQFSNLGNEIDIKINDDVIEINNKGFNCTFKYNNNEIKCANGINTFKL